VPPLFCWQRLPPLLAIDGAFTDRLRAFSPR
jgi:hypothetical protein